MKLIPLILSFVFGRLGGKSKSLRESALEIFEEITFRSRRLVSLLLVGLASVILLCGGLFISILNATTQYDRSGLIAWTATFSSGIALILIAAVTFSFVFLRAWPQSFRMKQKEQPTAPAGTSSLENALAALVMDYVKEREIKREQRGPSPSPSRPSHRKSTEEPQATQPLH